MSPVLINSFNSAPEIGAEPNIKKAINSGPIVVPNEFIPPARFSLFGPVAGSPKEITKGLAAVC